MSTARNNPKPEPVEYKSIYLPADIHRTIKQLATAQDRSMVNWMRRLVDREKAIHDAKV